MIWYILGTVGIIVIVAATVVVIGSRSIFKGIEEDEKSREEFRHL